MIRETAMGPHESNMNDNINKYESSNRENNHNVIDETEIPLDMTIRRKDTNKTPEGNSINYCIRPSVITKAPPTPVTVRQIKMENGSSESENITSTNCDLFIEEHFRRSLGNTYVSLYGNNNNNNGSSSSSHSSTSIEQPPISERAAAQPDEMGGEVDDHFAKALGNDTWKKIQAKKMDL